MKLVAASRLGQLLFVLSPCFVLVALAPPPLVIIGFIIYRVVVEHTRNGSDDAITLALYRTTPG